jgi:hypothetical protein
MNPAETSTTSFIDDTSRKYQYLLDKSSPHIMYRWIGFSLCLALYAVRVWYANGWYIVTYGLGIYLLNQFIGFLSPQVSSSLFTVILFFVIIFFSSFFFFFFFSSFFSPQSLTPKRMIWMVDYQRRILTNSGKAFVSTCLPDCNFPFSVQTLRQKITRIQILAFLRTICDYFLLYDLLPNFRCSSLLANSVVIFYRSFLYHDETTDQTHD